MKKRIHRRAFLNGTGGAIIALPMLEAMACSRGERVATTSDPRTPKQTRQALGTGPQRFIVFFSPNGMIPDRWTPSGTETAFEFKVAANPTAKHVLAPLEALKQKLIVLDGVNQNSRSLPGPGTNGHDLGMGHMMSAMPLLAGPGGSGEFGHLSDGSAGGISIDQEIANLIGNTTRFRSIELGNRSNLDPVRQITSRMSYKKAFEAIQPENDPRAAFATLFAGITPSGQMAPPALDALQLKRKSVLDKTQQDLVALIPKVSAFDRQKLEAHLNAIRELETSLALSSPPVTCQVPAMGPNTDPKPMANYPMIGQQQMDIMALAVACDLSRVVSLQWSTGQSSARFSWLGIQGDHHTISHAVDDSMESRQQMIDMHYWYSEQFAYLLGKLGAIDEMGQSALDNSIVMWVNEQGDAQPHSPDRIPYILAGSGGGVLRPGRYVKYTDASHNDLYLSLLKAFGSNLTVFGAPAVSKGALTGLT